jgi:hypothetical protein
MRLRGDVALLALDDEVVAFSEEAQRLISLNSSAAFVVRGLQTDAAPSTIESQLVAEGLASADEAAQWVKATMDALTAQGLVTGKVAGSNLAVAPAYPERPQDPRVAQLGPCPLFVPVLERRYRLLDTNMLVRFSLPKQVPWVDAVIGHLAVDDSWPATTVLDIQSVSLPSDRFGANIYKDSKPAAIADRLMLLGPSVKTELWQAAVNAFDLSFYFHAGVVGMGDGRCVLLPGAPGSGKSSLSIALTSKGFQYFSDEVAIVEPTKFEVCPVPLAACVKRGGWDVIAPYRPDIRSQVIHLRADGKRVRYLRPPDIDRDARGSISHIIFPRYNSEGQTRLEPIGRCEALRRLMEECLALRYRLDHHNVKRLVGWIARIECFTLNYASLEEAAELVRRTVYS